MCSLYAFSISSAVPNLWLELKKKLQIVLDGGWCGVGFVSSYDDDDDVLPRMIALSK